MWQVVASAQQCVAPSTTEQPFEPENLCASRKKGRDVASFGRVLEGLTGQTVHISPYMERHALFVCVFGALLRLKSESQGNDLADYH
ncbi:hypothetical protein GNF76_09825 [Pseudomonas sp. CCM 7893]|uniref:Uncharacterized protein n=1 Tax=Pseudomonas spelaei TaxID=1055469 RepID=A0A6I3W387_9PSED|nr:hypothetical protein [Pseudomonas spelaei]MUF04635.1 hypothetical protein [Pseudomonas spelaei]